MNTNQNKFGWGFWLRWVLASILGATVGVTIAGFAGSAMGEGFASMGTVGVIFGALLGTMQWLVMRKYVTLTGWWVLATAFGYFLAGIATEQWVFRQIPYWELGIQPAVAFLGVGSIAGGTMQWLILREHVARAGWWVVASIVGLVVGIGITVPVAIKFGQIGGIEFLIVFGILFGVSVGALPGAALVWLLRQHESGSSARTAERGAQ